MTPWYNLTLVDMPRINIREVADSGRPTACIFIRDTACFHCDSLNYESQFIESINYESQFIESQWKHAVSRVPAVRESATSLACLQSKLYRLSRCLCTLWSLKCLQQIVTRLGWHYVPSNAKIAKSQIISSKRTLRFWFSAWIICLSVLLVGRIKSLVYKF